jgi:hypothetical protein
MMMGIQETDPPAIPFRISLTKIRSGFGADWNPRFSQKIPDNAVAEVE